MSEYMKLKWHQCINEERLYTDNINDDNANDGQSMILQGFLTDIQNEPKTARYTVYSV